MVFTEYVKLVHQPVSRFVKVHFYIFKTPRQLFVHGAVLELFMSTRIGPPALQAQHRLLKLVSKCTGAIITIRALDVVQIFAIAMPSHLLQQ